MLKKPTIVALVILTAAACVAFKASADQVRVRYAEGVTRGFLVLRSQRGETLAGGESVQFVKNGIVNVHLTFKFKDGSIYEDTTTFTQHGVFRLLTDHLVQKGPIFPTQLETWIDARSGHVKVDSNKDGKREHDERTLDLLPDLANGMLFDLVKNLPSTSTATVSYIAFTPKPRIVKMVFRQNGTEKLLTGEASQEAIRFLMKVDLGGITGAVASVTGKKPADTQFWVIPGAAPTYAGSEGPLYGDGPVWTIELVSPARQSEKSAQSDRE